MPTAGRPAVIQKLELEQPRVQTVIVRVEKPGAVRFAASVGVEVERSRDETIQSQPTPLPAAGLAFSDRGDCFRLEQEFAAFLGP